MSLPTLHRLEDVAETYDLSLRTLRADACAKKFEHIRWGKSRYLTDAQLDALLRRLTVTPETTDAQAATVARLARRANRTARAVA